MPLSPDGEHVESPRVQRDEEAGSREVVAVAQVGLAPQQIIQPHLAAGQVRPAERDTTLCRVPAEVDHNEVPGTARTLPAPGEQVSAGLVVGPAGGFEQLPGA